MFCLHIKESCYRFQQLYYALQVVRYYVHQYETYMFKKLMKRFSMNCLHISHMHKNYSVYHAFMHTIKSSCHVSLTEQVDCSDCKNILQCSQEPQHGEAIILYLELVLAVLILLCVHKAEVMYMFEQSYAVLQLLCSHADVFYINNYRCSDYYHFLQVDQYIQLFCKGVRYNIMEVPNPRRS